MTGLDWRFILELVTPIVSTLVGFVVTITYTRLGKLDDRLIGLDRRLTALEAVENYKERVTNGMAVK